MLLSRIGLPWRSNNELLDRPMQEQGWYSDHPPLLGHRRKNRDSTGQHILLLGFSSPILACKAPSTCPILNRSREEERIR
ncbi:hypothetical protein MJO28_013182 [Puccinia striiformis f. sp. tritici]|uniref:Uncharacterized protein n=1 Tax=Puccinia striiformis f. sp. tritici TaxID=168172 RepID=A0ACC0DZF9_9BASI|nr:hypothetical protein MJO28_013182 [Puccinia striiformis f. sp. tritici]